MSLRSTPFRSSKIESSDSGFVLPLVVIAGLILGAGIMGLSAQTFSSLMGSIRQGQSRQAQEAGEAGLSVILRELNRNYPYLLISDCDVNPDTKRCLGWIPEGSSGGTWQPIVSKCPSAAQDPIGMQEKLRGNIQGNRSRYELISYKFTGDRQQGGVGEFKIKGESYLTNGTNTSNRATTIIEQSVSILPKSCDFPINSPAGKSGFPGLLADTVNMGNNDITGAVNANIMCLTCPPGQKSELVDDVNLSNQGVVEGNIFGGPIALPQPPKFEPPAGSGPFTRANIENTSTFVAGQSNGGSCFTDSRGVTHCLINRIELGGGRKSLCIFSQPGTYTNACTGSSVTVPESANGGVRFYFDQTDAQAWAPQSKPVITVSGTASILHTGAPENLGFFGLSRSTSSVPSQTVTLQGGAQAVGMFLFFPDGRVGIYGGASTPDIIGAIWARAYGGSNSNRVELAVPPNMGSLLWNTYGTEFGLGVREFAAVGTTAWRTFQLPTASR